LAYEFSNLSNCISHLYDVAFIMAALDSNGSIFVHTADETVSITPQFRLCLAIIFAVLSWCDKRIFEVKNINSTNPDQASVAIDYFKKYHMLAPE